MRTNSLAVALLVGLAGTVLAQAADEPIARPYAKTEDREPCQAYDALKRPFFGDLHVHTAFSFDANIQDTRNTPADAYRFAKGEPLGIQPYDEAGNALRTVQLARPLDFVGVTDHAELLAEVRTCSHPDSPGYDALICGVYRNFPTVAFQLIAARTLVLKSRWGMCGDPESCRQVVAGVWDEIIAAAEGAYDKSAACSFTSFVGYEWTATVGTGQNLHRNVIFRNHHVPELPTSWVETPSAIDLWDALEADCKRGTPGCDVLTIPHNSNLGSGLMFATAGVTSEEDLEVVPDDDELRRRSIYEPLVEVMQHKGDSECQIGGDTTDEACAFEKLPYDRFGAKFSMFVEQARPTQSSHLRDALKLGLRFQQERGLNPFRFGIIASTDTHIAAPGLTSEVDHPGHGGAGMASGEGVPLGLPDDLEFNPGGLAVVWAEENTRDSLFTAMQRREVYGTSGTRPIVRFFGGYEYGSGLCEDPERVTKAYAGGVPMGGVLPQPPEQAGAPRFLLQVAQDPGSEGLPGTPLERIQIIKGWVEGDRTREQVIDVAVAEQPGSVDPKTCTPSGAGARSLCAVWEDPNFDPSEQAFYYARALENPTCRWSQQLCVEAKVDCGSPDTVPEAFAGCCREDHRRVIRERAWTSPIWYQPTAEGS